MRHAKKLTESDRIAHRKALQGVMHYANGDLAVTDSHRLYYAKGIHMGEEVLLTPKGKKLDEKYPDIHRIFPGDPIKSLEIDLLEMRKAVDIISTGARISTKLEGLPAMGWESNLISFTAPDVSAKMKISYTAPEPFMVNIFYFFDAIKLLRSFKYRECIFNFYGRLRPFTLVSPDGKITALLLPIRSC